MAYSDGGCTQQQAVDCHAGTGGVLEGWLWKLNESAFKEAWRQRWVVQNGLKLLIYDSDSYHEAGERKKPTFVIDLSLMTACRQVTKAECQTAVFFSTLPAGAVGDNCFIIETPLKEYVFCTSTEMELVYWLNGLLRVNRMSEESDNATTTGRKPDGVESLSPERNNLPAGVSKGDSVSETRRAIRHHRQKKRELHSELAQLDRTRSELEGREADLRQQIYSRRIDFDLLLATHDVALEELRALKREYEARQAAHAPTPQSMSPPPDSSPSNLLGTTPLTDPLSDLLLS